MFGVIFWEDIVRDKKLYFFLKYFLCLQCHNYFEINCRVAKLMQLSLILLFLFLFYFFDRTSSKFSAQIIIRLIRINDPR